MKSTGVVNPYNNRRWQKMRLRQLRAEPLCFYHNGIEVATQVDHVVPFTDENDMMYDEDNLVSTCARCHQWITKEQPKMDFKGMSYDEAKVYKKSFMWVEVGLDGY